MPNGGEHGGSGGFGKSVESFKKTFFDPKKVTDPTERMIQQKLSRFGAFVRQRARTSIRYRDEPSQPGTPPSAHRTMMRLKKPRKGKKPGDTPSGKRQLTSPLRDFIYFGYEKPIQTVVIGPAKTNQTNKYARPSGGTMPQTEEEGGQLSIMEARLGGKWVRANVVSARRLQGAETRWRPVTIAARPYMRPAYEAELPGFLGGLKDSIKAG